MTDSQVRMIIGAVSGIALVVVGLLGACLSYPVLGQWGGLVGGVIAIGGFILTCTACGFRCT